MRKIYMLLIAVIASSCMWANQKIESENVVKNEQAEEITITWMTSDQRANAVGVGAPATYEGFMEFGSEDIFNFKKEGNRLKTVTNIQFCVEAVSSITDAKVVIKQGTELAKAATVYSQAVNPRELTERTWKSVTLDTPYTIDPSSNLYIGYEITTNSTAGPMSLATGGTKKQALAILNRNTIQDVSNYGALMIKASATIVDSPANEVGLILLTTPVSVLKGESLSLKGRIRNLGTEPLTSFKVKYEIDGKVSGIAEFTDVELAFGGIYNFTHPEEFSTENATLQYVKMTVLEPNGVEDDADNNTKINKLIVPNTGDIQRKVFHESFTSSTCGPCVAGNNNLKRVLDGADPEKYVLIKYQGNIPSLDPYYTLEGQRRYSYYTVSAVPTLAVDGPLGYKGGTGSYTAATLNRLSKIPAYAKLSGNAEVTGKTVKLDVTLQPLMTMNDADVRFFAAIIEKTTTNNIGSNGERIFYNVMKKFMTKVDGDELGSIEENVSKTLNYEYTFNGDYRKPTSLSNLINDEIEHSVEDFSDLAVVFWIQDIVSGDVYQAEIVDAVSEVGIENEESQMTRIFPNPVKDVLNIESGVEIKKISLVNALGQTVNESSVNSTEHTMNVNDLPAGMYILRIDTEEGLLIEKIQVK